jgi:hypothetical protein
MYRVYWRSIGTMVLPAVFCCLVGIVQVLPQPLSGDREVKAVGGCSSGLCSGQQNGACPYVNDACSGYSNCVSNDDGPSICTPASYCGSAGCGGQYNGGTCQ